jgi:hypothetical protein
VDSQPRHLTPAFAVSVVVHTAALAAILFLVSHTREEKPTNLSRLDPVKLVWIPDPRPAGRGGGWCTTETDAASAHTGTRGERTGTTKADRDRGITNDRA